MYKFHFKYIKSKFNTKRLFTDTDSIVHEIQTDGVYADYNENNCLILVILVFIKI